MLSESQRKNRYGAKFFIGSLVKIVQPCRYHENDLGKCGVVDGISGSIETGFEYSLGQSQSNMRAWFKEEQLDFVDSEEKETK